MNQDHIQKAAMKHIERLQAYEKAIHMLTTLVEENREVIVRLTEVAERHRAEINSLKAAVMQSHNAKSIH